MTNVAKENNTVANNEATEAKPVFRAGTSRAVALEIFLGLLRLVRRR